MARISRVGVSRGREGASTLKQIASTLAKKYYDEGSIDNDNFFSHQINQPGRQQPRQRTGFLQEGEYLVRSGEGRPDQTGGRRRVQR